MSSATEELNFNFNLILININSHMGLVATILDSAAMNSFHLFPAEITFNGNYPLS